jgi:hypothetical protein
MEVIENAGLKKSLRKTKVFLGNTYWYDTLALVESSASAMPGRFAFWGCSRPSLAGFSKIPFAQAKACATKTFAPFCVSLRKSARLPDRSRGKRQAASTTE